jgi:hypothetical protein
VTPGYSYSGGDALHVSLWGYGADVAWLESGTLVYLKNYGNGSDAQIIIKKLF